jgi:hypothetical protein
MLWQEQRAARSTIENTCVLLGLNYESQAGRAAQRQEAPPGIPGVGSAHSIQWQSRRGGTDTGEGADVLAKHTQATRAVRMTDPTGKPSCERRERVNTKSPVREYRPPGSVRGRWATGVPTSTNLKAETGRRDWRRVYCINATSESVSKAGLPLSGTTSQTPG